MPAAAFLPPAALQSEVNRTRVLLDQAEKDHQRALQSLSSAQQRVEHARGALAAKTAAREAAIQLRHDTEIELQGAKYFAEYFAAAWERKENELAKAVLQLHRSEVELKQANSAVEGVKNNALTALEVKEDAHKQLERAQRGHHKAKQKAEEAMARIQAQEAKERAAEEKERKAAEKREESLKKAQEKAAAAAGPVWAPPSLPASAGAIPGVVTADQLRELQNRATGAMATPGLLPANLLAAYPVASHASILAAMNMGSPGAPVAAAASPVAVEAAGVGMGGSAQKDAPNGEAKRSSRHRTRSRSASRDRRRRRGSSRGRTRSKSAERKRRRSRSRSRDKRKKRSRSRERKRSRSRERKRSPDRRDKQQNNGKDKDKSSAEKKDKDKDARSTRQRSRSRDKERARDKKPEPAEQPKSAARPAKPEIASPRHEQGRGRPLPGGPPHRRSPPRANGSERWQMGGD